MNKEEILAMEAGRELDALVGLKLGFVKPNVAEAFMTKSDELDQGSEKYGMKSLLPKYSTDISAAWEVMDKLKEKHDHIGIYYSTCIGKEWTCNITDLSEQFDEEGDFDVKDISADAETAQLAICRLALLAVME